ncbi:enoyl-CoA hydratase/isomerase family protein [Streptomyces sp. ME08-AFT2]|uniref:(3,5-dihydroxyphenyl)acetyl-CoA 1,2-dioxygenase DpgC n=1 Tax=Streptomyces sp. ME08-AFT2 TaxID=3028683 RepID=UPI0029A86914|nr:(3,5-dihydroxyphenyl)acetyl-CoA 1,2-dioxygenase DpgC [Streptomyces sp. ME08-AFT2]MDX3312437.1 enoyl-CoA hydratase/isomerase family protein [Streptomyces sp. ME08-AFT2]
MTAAPARTAVEPTCTGVLEDDAAALARVTAAADGVLAGLPDRPRRTAAEHRLAQDARAATRAARQGFLALHTDAVYDRLTGARSRHLRLSDLVYTAADAFPGLVPDRLQMAREAARPQADKEGYEIDQGVFCAAVLRSPTAGPHLIDAMLRPTARALGLLDAFRAGGRADLGSVRVERRRNAGHVTFHNGHCLNAEDNRLIADLETAVDLVLLDEECRAGVLRGGPVEHPKYRGRRVFSAGINLKELHSGGISFVDFLLARELGYLHKMLRGALTGPDAVAWTDRTTSKPWVGAVEAFAIGGGMQLLLVLDWVILESTAFVSLPAADEGIVPGLGNLRLTRLTGSRLARQVILGGRRIHATDPAARLVCDEVVDADGMDAAIDRATDRLGNPAVVANRRMLALAEEPIDLYRAYLAEFAVAQSRRAYDEDVLAKDVPGRRARGGRA